MRGVMACYLNALDDRNAEKGTSPMRVGFWPTTEASRTSAIDLPAAVRLFRKRSAEIQKANVAWVQVRGAMQ